jgi:predicted GNAT family acetyltransferase
MSAGPSVTVRDNAGKSRFEAVDDSGAVAGFATYRRRGDTVVFLHTEVDDAYEGQGVGSTLAKAALDAARHEQRRVDPQCPFIKSYIDRHTEYAELI